ncbi:replication restart DNA helicase PriA [Nocardia neocaledoniensis]|uniref:Probable replication restart protein PriA n=1 Tax=Nocardia neocaledoniensis TaxID=236511 RepID=A0A317P0Z8_9NOCA|nr:primosomal protein N' [Nocardia neocaledoniensis]PWV80923.1 replication restart DNA helicase PriA [Nocardia neocaledoniensis]
MLPLLSPAHLDRDFDYLVPPELDEIAQPGVRVRVRFAGRLVDGYLLERLPRTDHTGKMMTLERVVSAERVLTPEILRLATTVAARYAGTRADVLRLAIPPRHARTENGPATPRRSRSAATKSAVSAEQEPGPDEAPSAHPADSARAAEGDAAGDGDESREGESTIAPGQSAAEESVAGRAAAQSAAGDVAAGPVVAGVAAVGGAAAGAAGKSGGAAEVDTSAWGRYVHGGAFVAALRDGRGPRAAWQALPGEDWAARLAELAATVAAGGRGVVLMVPDQRDLDRLLAECVRLVGDSAVGLSAGLGPAARYRRWLSVLRGQARIVVGTRAAVFAPVRDLGLIALWDDGDDTYAEPRAPYPHAREVAMLRAHETGAAFVAAGFARTAEIQAVVESGWARDLLAERQVLREVMPRISAPGDTDFALERDALARSVRMPGVAFAAARAALRENAAVLVQVPRRGYVPSLACAKCRTPARCRHCHGPLALPQSTTGEAASPQCKWCGITEAAYRCQACGARALRATVIGAARTAEELGRAFPGVPIRGSGGGEVLDTVEPGAQVVVATVGAEPLVPGGYGVALLLDGWALLGRADLRATEDTLRRWLGAAALVRPRGQVIVMAEPSLPTVQALVRWDPVHHAAAELAARAEVGFPPAVRLAAIDGTAASIAELLDVAQLPEHVEVLGPVPLPPTARKPFSGAEEPADVERMLLRVGRTEGAPLARALTAARAVRSSHRSDAPLRVQMDPVDIG